jgi:outer membrane scaffolding protein for murein synthesis (MipA/OmpV family)
MKQIVVAVGAVLAAAMGSPASAQTVDAPPATPLPEPPVPEPAVPSEYLTLGVGAAFVPDYEGSDDHRIVPGPVIRAKTGGISIFSRGTYLYADFVDRPGGVDLDLGPIVGVRLNRTGKIKDDVVAELDDRNAAVEVGGFGGVTFKGLTNPYDSLSVRLDAVKDVASAHESWVFTPTVEFGTPLSLTTFVGASLSADFVSDRYADYYFGIDADEALRTGLAAYRPDGGFKSWQAGLLVSQSLSGDLRRGLALFGTGSYKRLRGDFADSPLVADRGSRGQWSAALGIGYTF